MASVADAVVVCICLIMIEHMRAVVFSIDPMIAIGVDLRNA